MDAKTGAIKTPAQMNNQANPISVGGEGRADELCYDPKDNIILIASPADGFVTFISAAAANKGKVLGQLKITTGTGIEQCAWNPKDGNFYQNVPNDPDAGDQVLVISPTNPLKVVRPINIDIKDCSGVRGNAFGLDNQLLIGCSTPSPPNNQRNSIVIDSTSGPTAKVLKVLKNLGGADEVWFNPDTNHYVIPSCNTPSGPEKSFPAGLTPANPGLGNCVTPAGFFASTTSIALLLRSAKKNLLSFGSNQLMSNENNVPAVFEAAAGTCMTVVTLNTSSFLDEFPSSLSSVRAGPARASMAMAPIAIPATCFFFDRNL